MKLRHLIFQLKLKTHVFLAFSLLLFSCSEDVIENMAPDKTVVINEVVISPVITSTEAVPELKSISFDIELMYNNKIKRKIKSHELSNIDWNIDSDDISLQNDTNRQDTIKLSGLGTGSVSILYRACPESGHRDIVSNPVVLSTVETKLDALMVQTAENHTIGCQPNENPDRLVEGCLMQFQAIAVYDNDVTVDVTDQAIWSVYNESVFVALVENVDSTTDFASKTWVDIVFNYINENVLNQKKGLVLGVTPGNYQIEASYENVNNQSEAGISTNKSVIKTTVNKLVVSANNKGTSLDCGHNQPCQLYTNTIQYFSAWGETDNNISGVMTQQVSWSSSHPDLISIGQNNGVANISQDVDSVTITAKAGTASDTIQIDIVAEEIVDVTVDFPNIADVIDAVTNRLESFRLVGIYNNDDFYVLDTTARQKTLNLETIDWDTSNHNIAYFDDADDDKNWDDYNAKILYVKSEVDGETCDVSAHWVAGDKTFNWILSIDNKATTPITISISPSDPSGDQYTIQGGVETQFTALATFTNNTSRILNSSEVQWSSQPETCLIYSIPQICIDPSGRLTTYEPVTITATTTINPEQSRNIVADLPIIVDPSPLKTMDVIPKHQEVYEGTQLLYTAIGNFANNRSHDISNDCLNWQINVPSNIASISSQGFLTTLDATDNMTVTATVNTSACDIPGRSLPQGSFGDTQLTVRALPRVNFFHTGFFDVSETAFEVTVTVVADTTYDADMTIPFQVSGTAEIGADHDLLPGFFTIPIGSTQDSITVNITDDDVDEYDETIFIKMVASSMVNAEVGDATPDITITITDNDETPDVQFRKSSSDTHEDCGEVSVYLDLIPSGTVSGRDVSIDYSVTGTSTAGTDHTLSSGSIQIPAGESTGQITFDISNDIFKESDETIVLTLTGSNNAALGSNITHTMTILSDDSLMIWGTPTTSCNATVSCPSYSFQPLTNLENIGDATFDIWNQPDWLKFNTDNGHLEYLSSPTGGKYTDITICVDDADEYLCLPTFDITVD